MLNKRTQILFSEETWKHLAKIAALRKESIGNLVRKAVEKEYLPPPDLEQRRKVIEEILRIRPKPVKGKIDYKKLINAGRRYL